MARYTALTSDKSKNTAAILCSVGFLGVGGLHYFYVGKIGKGLLHLFTCGLFLFGTIFDLIKILSGGFKDNAGAPLRTSKKAVELFSEYKPPTEDEANQKHIASHKAPTHKAPTHKAPTHKEPLQKEPVGEPTPRKSKDEKRPVVNAINLPLYPTGFERKYLYKDVPVAGRGHYALGGINVGDEIIFKVEPDNEYDSEAVALFVEKHKIGYIHRGTKQKMYHDFKNKNGLVLARVSALDEDSTQMILGYYEPVGQEYGRLLSRGSPYKTYTLMGNQNDEMQLNLEYCTPHAQVEIEYDFSKERFMALSGGEIGYFPKKASEIDEQSKAFIKSIELDDKDMYRAKVDVF